MAKVLDLVGTLHWRVAIYCRICAQEVMDSWAARMVPFEDDE